MKKVDSETMAILQEKVEKGELPPIYGMPGAVEAIIEYDEKVKQQKEWLEKYPLIKAGKLPIENFNRKLLPKLSQKAVDYGFHILLMDLIAELDITNESIVDYFELWKEKHENSVRTIVLNNYIYTRERYLGKSIVHDLKHFADMIISIVWILVQKGVVKKIEIDSLGKYFHQKEFKCFDDYRDFLNTLNKMDNVQKHAITNQMTQFIGKDEPCFYSIDSNHNNDIGHVDIKVVSVSQTVEQFNAFYKFSMDKISELCS